MRVDDWPDKEQLASSVETNVWTHLFCHFVFATEIGCLCEQDSLNFLSRRLIVCNCFRVTVPVYVQHPMSDQANFTETLNFGGVLFPDPIRCCQSQKLNTLFILSPSLSGPSLLVTLPLSHANPTLSLYFKFFFFFPQHLQLIHGARETSRATVENCFKEKLICI